MITGIIVALEAELTTLTAKKLKQGQCIELTETIWLCYSGMGAVNAENSAQNLINLGATQLISWGCAAGLIKELQSGDLILADTFIDHHNIKLSISPLWANYSEKILAKFCKIYHGYLIESNQIIQSSTDKQFLYDNSGAIALDMETVAIAKIALKYQLPLLTIRVIADPLSISLPPAVIQNMDQKGNINLIQLIRYLFFHPSEIIKLIQLGGCFYKAKKTLCQIAKQLTVIVNW